MNCPSCGGALLASHRFCPSCGTSIGSSSQAPTAANATPAAAGPLPAPVGRLISSDSLPVGGFTPGMVLAGRYRIIGLIGRGGMGEVYRADDLKLGQPVALKFLPKALADDPVRRERLFAEVRIARQVSHPNICRVYDIGELEGRHFLTMEYIDGEDLASLLKRIGSLHGTKALDVARQLCAGLVAAHDKGVLHRDLKPANVMLDGRGHVRITDFGLAVAAGEEVSAEDVSGTPPYMAPEQFTGKGASVRSDIYALGLIFYEIYTGRRAFEARTLAELRTKKESSLPTAPSEIARDIDPIVERVILRCMEKDPRQRPASAAQVAAALPGGDPLAAAIAAGETPSPEMVAASGSTEGLKPWIAWACLAFVILGLGAFVLQGRQYRLIQRISLEKPPDGMAERAREILTNLGYSNPPGDSVYRFVTNDSYFQVIAKSDNSPKRYEKLPPLAVQFWYRQSPEGLTHSPLSSGITPTDPSFINKGESIIWLDSRGNLTGFQAIPIGQSKPPGAVSPPDWSPLFKAAGFDPAKYTSAEPDWAPLAYADARAAWKGVLPDFPEIPIRIEAAAWQGKPVLWHLIVPFHEGSSISTDSSQAWPMISIDSSQTRPMISIVARLLMAACIVIAGMFFARRNLRMGRGDRRGANRLACFILVLEMIAFIFSDHLGSMAFPLQVGIAWLMYIALEPFVRRRWPGMMVGWSRLLTGKYRDPIVGRDLLLGSAAGLVVALSVYWGLALTTLLRLPQPSPEEGGGFVGLGHLYLFSGSRAIIVGVSGAIITSISFALIAGFLLFLFRVLFRYTWIAAALFILITCTATPAIGEPRIYLLVPLIAAIHLLIIFRFGLLAWMAEHLFYNLLNIFPFTSNLSAWYSGIGLTGLVLLLAFTFYAFHTSLGGQPMFGRASLED